MKSRSLFKRVAVSDVVIISIIFIWALIILIPFINVIMISFTTENEYLSSIVFLYPNNPTLGNYKEILKDSRIWIGYKNTLTLLLIGLPLSMFLTASFSYGMSRTGYPGKKLIFMYVLVTMFFNGGIVPLYLLMRQLGLTNTLWSIILANSVNTFYMILVRNFFYSIPESLIESAKLDGASEWRILWNIVLPLSMPIMATVFLFYTVDRWNEWYHPLIFLQRAVLHPLQLVLRSIVMDSQLEVLIAQSGGSVVIDEHNFSMGIKTATIFIAMLPVMILFPFLQKHFVKGVLIGAVKS